MDQQQLKQFLVDSFTMGNAALGIALGTELGLFNVMSDLNKPFTSQELSDAGNFKERYITEWLGAMACSKVIDYNVDTGQFSISRENVEVLINSPEPSMLGMLAVSGTRHELLKTAFRKDGPIGIPLFENPRIGPWLDEWRKNQFGHVLEKDVLNISGLRAKFESGICAADIACGSGRMALLMAQRFPNSTFWALDIDEAVLAIGRQRAKEANIQNVFFKQEDAHNFSSSLHSKFDYVFTYDCIHDLPYPGKAIEEIYKTLKAGGMYSMMEPHAETNLSDNIKDPNATSLYAVSLYWCMPHSLSNGGEGHGRTLGVDRMSNLLKVAGFTNIKRTKAVSDSNMDNFMCQK